MKRENLLKRLQLALAHRIAVLETVEWMHKAWVRNFRSVIEKEANQ